MELKDIASVKGKSGLFKVLKTTPSSLLLEPLSDTQSGIQVIPLHKASLLGDITMYTRNKEGSIPLENVLKTLWEKHGENLEITPDAPPEKLKVFIKAILPDYDEQRVYVSDIKKLIKWYILLLQQAPETVKGHKTPPIEEGTDTKQGKEESKQKESKQKESKQKESKQKESKQKESKQKEG